MEFYRFHLFKTGPDRDVYCIKKKNKNYFYPTFISRQSQKCQIQEKMYFVKLCDQFREYTVTRTNKIGMREVSDMPF